MSTLYRWAVLTKTNKKKNEEYKSIDIKIQSLKFKYFLKTVIVSLLQESSATTGTSSEVKKTIQS